MELTDTNKSMKHWYMLTLSLIAIIIMYISYIGYSLASLDIMDDLSLNYTQLGSLASISALTGGIAVFFAWLFVDKFGSKTISIASLLTCAIGLVLFSFAESYGIAMLSRAIQGVGVAICFNAPYTFATNWFEGKGHTSTCTGLLMAADGMGTFFTLYLYTFVIQAFGWRTGSLVGAGIIVLCAIVFGLLAKRPPSEADVKVELEDKAGRYLRAVKNRNTIPAACFIIGLWGSYGVAVYWVPTILVEDAGWTESAAGITGSLYAVLGIISAIGMGAVSDRLGKRKPLIVTAGILFMSAFILAAIAMVTKQYILLAVALPLSGFTAYAGQPLAYASAVLNMNSKDISAIYGFIMAIGLLVGALLYPVTMGFIKDVTGEYVTGFIAVVISLAILNVFAPLFMKDYK